MQKARKGFLYLYGVSSGICIKGCLLTKLGLKLILLVIIFNFAYDNKYLWVLSCLPLLMIISTHVLNHICFQL